MTVLLEDGVQIHCLLLQEEHTRSAGGQVDHNPETCKGSKLSFGGLVVFFSPSLECLWNRLLTGPLLTN